MLPKKNRADSRFFEKILQKGRFFSSKSFNLRILADCSGEDKPPKFSFAAPKKVAKKAVERNFLRRKGYEAAKNVVGETKFGIGAVFLLKKEAEETSAEDLAEEIKAALEKAGALK